MRIHRCLPGMLCVVSALAASGCFQSSTLIKLKPDGSGTIEQTLTMTAEAAQQLTAFAAMGGDKSKPAASGPNDFFSEEDAKSAVAKMGGGVTYVSSQRIDTPERKGRKALYSFSDIRKLTVQEMSAPRAAGEAGPASGAAKEAAMKFNFTQMPGGHSLLTIGMPVPVMPTADMAPPSSPLQNNPQMMEMMKMFLKGLQVDAAIEVDRLIKTNSPYVNGSRVTLLSIDFDRVLADPALLEQMQKAKTLADAKAFLKDSKGFKISLEPELTIEFTGGPR